MSESFFLTCFIQVYLHQHSGVKHDIILLGKGDFHLVCNNILIIQLICGFFGCKIGAFADIDDFAMKDGIGVRLTGQRNLLTDLQLADCVFIYICQ